MTSVDVASIVVLITVCGFFVYSINTWRKDLGALYDQIGTFRVQVQALENKIQGFHGKISDLQDKIIDLQMENDELKVGITILIEQLRVRGEAPEWRPRPRKSQSQREEPNG